MNGYVIIMRFFRNCPHCSVSRVIKKLKFLFFIFCQKVAAVSNYLPNYFANRNEFNVVIMPRITYLAQFYGSTQFIIDYVI